MKYIFKFIEYINETDILNFGLLIFVIGYLINLHSKKEEAEDYLGLKLTIFYLLGAFSFNLNFETLSIVIPAGFVIYYIFMKDKERRNLIIKEKATILGLIMLYVGVLNSMVYNAVEYRDREIPVKNISVKSLRDDYEIIKKELGIGDTVGVDLFNVDYDENNKIRMAYYDLRDIDNNKYYYISANSNSYTVSVRKIDDNENNSFMFGTMYNSNIETLLDVVSNTKFKNHEDASYYTLMYRDGDNYYEDDSNLYTVDLDNYSTEKFNSKYPIYDVFGINHIPMKQVSEESWEGIKTDTYLIWYNIDESSDEDL